MAERARNDLRRLLRKAATERHQREGILGGEPGWVSYERGVMHRRVNELRERAGLPPVDLAEFEAAERRALGHVDYADKFSLYSAWLASGWPSTGPS